MVLLVILLQKKWQKVPELRQIVITELRLLEWQDQMPWKGIKQVQSLLVLLIETKCGQLRLL